MDKIFSLKGRVQNYAWGGDQFIPDLLSLDLHGEKAAEYWLGAHENAPSLLLSQQGEEPLDAFVARNPKETLGPEIAEKFGRLPFLFKVLDVHDMLSIQVHPTKAEAERGFEDENQKGIPIKAPYRNYKDDNHKPEIMVALSDFWLLHGFLPKKELLKRLKSIPEFFDLIGVFEEQGYPGLYKTVMQQPDEVTTQVLKPLIDRIYPVYKAGRVAKSDPDYWAAKAYDLASDKNTLDKGLYSIYFFNIVKANRGEAIFQDAGIPHAYLEGKNIELMANSDNVLRGGLTGKHVDVPELLKHIKFEETIPNLIKGNLQQDGTERIYSSPAPDFELSKIELNASQEYTSHALSPQILLVLEGEAQLTHGNKQISLVKGGAAFIVAGCDYSITSESKAEIYKASVP